MKTSDLLIAAKAKISDPAHWTKNHFARTADGCQCSYSNRNATCWCSLGAVLSIPVGVTLCRAHEGAIECLRDATDNNQVPLFNDHPDTTHADVMLMFDRAIEAAKRSEKLW